VENWPGEQRIEGEQLMERIRSQAEVNGALYVQEEVIGIDFSKRPFTITTKSVIDPSSVRTIRAASCIIATGSSPNVLGIPGEKNTGDEVFRVAPFAMDLCIKASA
jgi:thioredoxin reductase (NADPH)